MDDTRTEDLRQMKCGLLRALRSLNAALGPRGALETEDDPSRGVWLFEDGDDDFWAEAGGGPMLAGYVRGRGDGWTVFNPDGTVDEVASGPETGAKARRLVEEAWNRACLASPEHRSKARGGEEEAAAFRGFGDEWVGLWRYYRDGLHLRHELFARAMTGRDDDVLCGEVGPDGWRAYGPNGVLASQGTDIGEKGKRRVEEAWIEMCRRTKQRGEPDGEWGTLAGRVAKLEHDLGSWAYWNFADMADRLDGHVEDLDRAAERLSIVEGEALKAGRIASEADGRASIANARQVAIERRLSEVVERLEKLDGRVEVAEIVSSRNWKYLRRVIEIVEARLDGFSVDEYPVSGRSRGLLRILDGEAEDV